MPKHLLLGVFGALGITLFFARYCFFSGEKTKLLKTICFHSLKSLAACPVKRNLVIEGKRMYTVHKTHPRNLTA